jgi:hypothetical protein
MFSYEEIGKAIERAIKLAEEKPQSPVSDSIARCIIDDTLISTVYLKMFVIEGEAYETMILGGEHDQYQERYTTRDMALKGHERAVALVKDSKSDDKEETQSSN